MKTYVISKSINRLGWDSIDKIEDFDYPWRDEIAPKTTFEAYYDDEYIYFRFVAACVAPKVFVDNNNKLEVVNSERVEIFFRSNKKMQTYYCLEMDPYGRVLDYKAESYRIFDRTWRWPGGLPMKVKVLKDVYEVEGKISFSILHDLNLIKNNRIEIGLFRGHCTNIKEGKATINWISWVHPNTIEPDFHVPSSFGVLYLKPN
jgi:hypothetical protein